MSRRYILAIYTECALPSHAEAVETECDSFIWKMSRKFCPTFILLILFKSIALHVYGKMVFMYIVLGGNIKGCMFLENSLSFTKGVMFLKGGDKI